MKSSESLQDMINVQKSIVFLDTCNEQSENKVNKIIPLTAASKNKMLLELRLTK